MKNDSRLLEPANDPAYIFNSSFDGKELPYYKFYSEAQIITGLICYPVICISGLIGNILILIVLAQKSMRTPTNVYLRCLAISDIIKLTNDFLYFLAIMFNQIDKTMANVMYGSVYPYAHFVFNMCVCVSAWLTVSVSVTRYILVCHPAWGKTHITVARAKKISIICFVIMTLLAVPSGLRYSTPAADVTAKNSTLANDNETVLSVSLTQLWQNDLFVQTYIWLQSSLRSIVPFIILIVMNVFIIRETRKKRANKALASRKRITAMLTIMTLFFLCCITPDAIMSTVFNMGYGESDSYLVRGVREISDTLLAFNAAVNFVIYMVFNKTFSAHFRKVFCKRNGSEIISPTEIRAGNALLQTSRVRANTLDFETRV